MNLSRGTVGGHHEAGGSPSAKAEQSGEWRWAVWA